MSLSHHGAEKSIAEDPFVEQAIDDVRLESFAYRVKAGGRSPTADNRLIAKTAFDNLVVVDDGEERL